MKLLRSRRPKDVGLEGKEHNENESCPGVRILGFSLFELMLGLAVAGILTSIAVPMFSGYVYDANVGRAIADIGALQLDIEKFRLNNDRLPNDMGEIGRAGMLDPFGNAYEFTNFALVPPGKRRKDRNLVPINTDYDLFSKGKDGGSVAPLTAKKSRDDIVRANNGQFIGLASDY